MNGSTESRASDAFERPGRREVVLNLGTARRMLPLVMGIVQDVMSCRQRLRRLTPEQECLDWQRQKLAWPQRRRRYQVREELDVVEKALHQAMTELDQLGVALLDAEEGRVGLPTNVNNHLAFFSWKPGDDGLRFWHFAGETNRRNIPATWKETGDIRLVSKF